jgi:hypothetical protein
VSAGLDVDMDVLQLFNAPADTTSPTFFTARAENGSDMNIPCPGV